MRRPLDFTGFEALTFDCYGTLIDWETGIVEAAGALVAGRPEPAPPPDRILERFALLEAVAERGAHRPYRDVLAEVARGLSSWLGVEPEPDALAAFADSVGRWPPFEDSTEALRALGRRHRLAVVSNVDDDLFARSAERLGIDFDEVVTAEQVRSYKPAEAHFHEVVRRLGLQTGRILHVAQSLYHDVAPAKALGFACVWVNRRAGRSGGGATPSAVANPDLEVPGLAALVAAIGAD